MKSLKPILICLFALGSLMPWTQAESSGAAIAKGPLRVHPDNPRYFTDGTKGPDGALRAVYLSGFQFWEVFDADGSPSPDGMEYEEFLEIAEKYGVNFIRLWRWNELTRFHFRSEVAVNHHVHPWARTGPGQARDGKPKFDLQRFNQDYFDTLRARVVQAGDRGMYVAVMLFEGWSLRNANKPWASDSHPFNQPDPGREYLVYQPRAGDAFTVELDAGKYQYEWFSPEQAKAAGTGHVEASGAPHPFKPPFGGDAVLYVKKSD